MSKGKDSPRAEFCLEGRFLGYIFEENRIKRLLLKTIGEQEYSIKMTKKARRSLARTLFPGDWIAVSGTQKITHKFGTKFKARSIVLPNEIRSAAQSAILTETPAAIATPQKSAAMSVLYCQKSSCMKRGGKAMCHALTDALRDRGLADQVKVKGTGCMKACGKHPVVFMPDKERYTKVSADDVATLVDEHFSRSIPPVRSTPSIPATPPIPSPPRTAPVLLPA